MQLIHFMMKVRQCHNLKKLAQYHKFRSFLIKMQVIQFFI